MEREDLKSKKIAVTGATGFIGRYFTLYLRNQGYSVLALIRKTSDCLFLENEGIPYLKVDFSNHIELTRALVDVKKIVHIGGPGLSELVAGIESSEPNIAPLIEACLRANIERVVYLSTIKAGKPKPYAENKADNESFENDVYGKRKHLEELELMKKGEQLNWLIIRAPAVYGPLDNKMLDVFKLSQKSFVPILPESKCSQFSIIHVEDLARGLFLAVNSTLPSSEVIEISNPNPTTWNELIKILLPLGSKTVTIPYTLLWVITWVVSAIASIKGIKNSLVVDRLKDITEYNWISDTDAAKQKFSYNTSIPLHNGLKDCLEQYKKAGLI